MPGSESFSMRGKHELQGTFTVESEGVYCHISGLSVTNDGNILVTDCANRVIKVYNIHGQCNKTQVFGGNVWDCVGLSDGGIALLTDDWVKIYTKDWVFEHKFRVPRIGLRQIVSDDDEFLITADIESFKIITYHIESCDSVSEFTTTATANLPDFPAAKEIPSFYDRSGALKKPAQIPKGYSEYCGTGLAMDSNGDLYIADKNQHTIRVFNMFGGEDEEMAYDNSIVQLSKPLAVCHSCEDTIYVADSGKSRVMRFKKDWSECMMVLGKEQGLQHPVSLALIKDKNLLVVADRNNTIFLVKHVF